MEIEESDKSKKPHIPIKDRWEVISYKKQGYTGTQLQQILSIPASTCNAIYRKYLETGNVEDLEKSGRPKKTNPDEDKMLIETIQGESGMTINEAIEEAKLEISKTTGWRRLIDNGLRCRSVPVKWSMTEKHKKDRLLWAKQYIKKEKNFWQRVIFTDESLVQFNTKRQKCWVYSDEKPEPVERDRWQFSLLLWGAISFDRNCILEVMSGTLNSDDYEKILKRRLLKNYPGLRGDSTQASESYCLIYQQDNAQIHVAKNVNKYFDDRQILRLSWPAKSPDLNVMETVWAFIKSKLKGSYESQKELEEDIVYLWENLPSEFIVNLYDSLPRRIQAIIDCKGGPTKY